MPEEPCPNQIPPDIRTGIDAKTETRTGTNYDPEANYLVAKALIPADTLFSVFGEAVIVREQSTAGRELRRHYTSIQKTGNKCQYTFRATPGSKDEYYWVIPQQDVDTRFAEGKPAQPAQGLSSTGQTLKSFQMYKNTSMTVQGTP